MEARRGKCPKNHFFCIFGLLSYRYNIYQVRMEFRKLFDILVHPSGQGILGQYVHLLKLGQYVAGTICHWDNMSQDKMSPQYS